MENLLEIYKNGDQVTHKVNWGLLKSFDDAIPLLDELNAALENVRRFHDVDLHRSVLQGAADILDACDTKVVFEKNRQFIEMLSMTSEMKKEMDAIIKERAKKWRGQTKP